MDAQQFLAEFGHIAHAPGGIQQLREMVYQLAITGKLTFKAEENDDARTLLADIKALRERLIQEKKYKRLPKLESEALDIPHGIELPPNWCWTRLLDIGEISPRNDAQDEAQASFIPMSGIPQLHMGVLAPEPALWHEIKKGFTHFANGDVVVAKITPCFENGKAAVIDGLKHSIGAGTTELHVFRPIHPGVLPGYIYLFLRSPYFAIEGEKKMTGTAGQKRLPTDFFATRALPLPPTKEQRRIVAKVDELMALCDKLEDQQQQRRSLQNNLRQSTLQVFAAATSPHELQTTWARLAVNFGQLFHAPEDVADLRDLISDLAVKGLLTKQEPSDEPAEELLKRFRDEKQKVSAGSRRRNKVETDYADDLVSPYELPVGWIWCQLEQVSSDIQYGHTASANTKVGDCLFLRITDIQNNQVAWASVPKCTINTKEIPKYALKNGDIVIARTGGTIGKSYLVNGLDQTAIFASYLIRIGRLESSCPDYTKIFLSSTVYWNQLYEKSMGTGQPNVSGTSLKSLLFPLPPFNEQDRIVKRVAELMRFCDFLETQLRHSKELAGHLAIAAVSSITGITTKIEEDELVKVPQTELVAPLLLGKTPENSDLAPLATILARHNGGMRANDLCQRFCGIEQIDAFYAQLKTEVAHGWILEPGVAEMREKLTEKARI